jgi:hypothetical protein
MVTSVGLVPPLWHLVSLVFTVSVVSAVEAAASATGSCAAGQDASEGCSAIAEPSRAEAFWAEMRKRGLQLKIRRKTVEDKAQAGRPARNRTAMVLKDDVFYGRAIMKIPRPVLLSHDTAAISADLRRDLSRLLFEDKVMQKKYNVTGEDSIHLLSLAYPLIAENRDPSSVFREWLDAVRDERVPVLQLSERQLRVLTGTTVEGAFEEMRRNTDLIQHSARNVSIFRDDPVSREEAAWALAVIMRHARVVHPHQDVRESSDPRMYLIPLVELLGVEFHHDPGVGISFQEEITYEGKREEEMVLQIARRDMAKGEEVFLWAGRFSNSDMVVRHGRAFAFNQIGIGRNVTQPPNWENNPASNIRKEYDKYNCTNLEAFELRLSALGTPSRTWVRCYRVSWFLANGWYSPALTKRVRELDKWPPPKKYTKEDWLSWTQADREANKVVTEYCQMMKQQLKDTIDTATANDFRKSSDPVDQLLWYLRGEESRTFKGCVTACKAIDL